MIEMPCTESQPFSPWVPPRFSAPEFSSQHLLGSTQTIVRGCGSSYKEKARGEDKWKGFKVYLFQTVPGIKCMSVQIVSRMRYASGRNHMNSTGGVWGSDKASVKVVPCKWPSWRKAVGILSCREKGLWF
uniref:Uncharacterized protein n=1 Tax=Micrurus spixii TaxID=129469 RepID=A0A2D4LG41_9SAUR